MNPKTASFSRYWEPNYFQATSISLIAGTIASFATYPCEYMKTVIQHQAIGVGLRSRYCIIINIQSKDKVTTLSKYYGLSLRVEEDFKEFSKASRHIFSADLVTCLPEIVSI